MTDEPKFIPRTPRIDARHPAVLVASDGGEMQVIVTDLSNRGFRIEAEENLFIIIRRQPAERPSRARPNRRRIGA